MVAFLFSVGSDMDFGDIDFSVSIKLEYVTSDSSIVFLDINLLPYVQKLNMGGGGDFDADIADRDEGKCSYVEPFVYINLLNGFWLTIVVGIMNLQEMMTVTRRMKLRKKELQLVVNHIQHLLAMNQKQKLERTGRSKKLERI